MPVISTTTREILVMGHPRSGTGYLSQLLAAYGLAVGHERMGADGIASWMFAAVTKSVPFSFDDSARANYAFRHRIHIVRHPLKVIASAAYTEVTNPKSLDYMAKFIVVQKTTGFFERACRTYIGWNKLIDAQMPDLRLRVEEAVTVLPHFLKQRGLRRHGAFRQSLPPTNYNSRPHPDLTAHELRSAIPSSLWDELCDYARSLGYGDLRNA